MDYDVTIVGAGPYGLASAAYLRNKGIGVRVFGDPMSFWQNHMPAGMFLRSNWLASHISDPRRKLTLDQFRADIGEQFAYPIPLEKFVQYGHWYQQKAVPDLCRCQVRGVEKKVNGFEVSLSDGQKVTSKRVVVATGIAPFPWMPEEFAGAPKSHVSHSSDHADLSRFCGQQVLVIGGGQSALDAARIMHANNIGVELVAKQAELNWVGEHYWLHRLGIISSCLYSKFDVGPAGISRLVGFPNFFRRLPRSWQEPINRRTLRPAGTGWQRPGLARVTMTLDCHVTSYKIMADKIHLALSNGTERVVDHVIVATGYRVDCGRYGFLSPAIRKSLKTAAGHPILDRAFESSIPGMHFVGKPAAWSFGPLLNFISGTHFASSELMRAFS